MTHAGQGESETLRFNDFDALYRGERELTVGDEQINFTVIPWDIGGPQPAIVELEEAGAFTDPVLEAGCGLGENALFLAGRGHHVTAFDAAPAAIEGNRRRATERGSSAEFLVSDATTLDGITGRFRTVLDSALLHCLDEAQRRAYLTALHRVCEPGARLYVLCFSDGMPSGFPGPFTFSEDDVRRTVTDGWTIRELRRVSYISAMTPDTLAAMSPQALLGQRESDFQLDERGRILLPMWQVTAERI